LRYGSGRRNGYGNRGGCGSYRWIIADAAAGKDGTREDCHRDYSYSFQFHNP
jgi:hypothetical protein